MATDQGSGPRPSCHAVVCEGDRVLLVLRAHPPFAGWWGLPGGAVERGETVTDALRREVREETGLDVTVERLLGYRDAIDRDERGHVRYHYVILFFLARPVGGALVAASDAADARWVPAAALPGLRLVPGAREVLQAANVWPSG